MSVRLAKSLLSRPFLTRREFRVLIVMSLLVLGILLILWVILLRLRMGSSLALIVLLMTRVERWIYICSGRYGITLLSMNVIPVLRVVPRRLI